MIQAIGLTSTPRRSRPLAVDDLTFEARPGLITVLLGAQGAGKSTTLRLMLQLESGRGLALFRGRPLHRIAHPAREVGVLLGDVPGHPGRTARGHLRMLSAAVGVRSDRVDDVLEVVGLSGLADGRLGSFSFGMDRRLGLAAALLADPHTLVLDEPAQGLSPRESVWLHHLLRAYAGQGGAVLVTSREPREAARIADRVVTIDAGRLVADQAVTDFAASRLRPRVSVRSPHAARLASLIDAEVRPSGGTVEVVQEGGSRIAVYGSTCAAVGETAFRHGILVHQLADEVVDTGPVTPLERADGRRSATHGPASREPGSLMARTVGGPQRHPRMSVSETAPSITPRAPVGPAWPMRYELHRAVGVRAGWWIMAVTILASLAVAVPLARAGHESALRQLAGWPGGLPLPPTALGAGLLGALAFGQEFRYPALGHTQSPVPRRLGLLAAKLTLSSAVAVVLTSVTLLLDGAVLQLLFGGSLAWFPVDRPVQVTAWFALVVGCGWAGVLAAGLFRSTVAGLAAVLAVPVVVVPAVRALVGEPTANSLVGLSERLRLASMGQWPSGAGRWTQIASQLASQPVGRALALSLAALACAYLISVLRGRIR